MDEKEPTPEETAVKGHELVESMLNEKDSKDYFAIMGLEFNIEFQERGVMILDSIIVKKKYRKVALIIHPDKCTHPNAGDAFKLLGEAFDCLTDPTHQKEYIVKLLNKKRKIRDGHGEKSYHKRYKSNSTAWAKEYEEAVKKSAMKEDQKKKERQEKIQKAQTERMEELKQQFSEESVNNHCHAWQKWNKSGKKTKTMKTGVSSSRVENNNIPISPSVSDNFPKTIRHRSGSAMTLQKHQTETPLLENPSE